MIRPGADQLPGCSLPQNSAEGVNDNGLARARLTRQGIESGPKGDVRLLNDGNILNMQQIKHIVLPSSQCSIVRMLVASSAALSLSRIMISTVSSPARVPISWSISMPSRAAAAPLARPDMVWMTTRFCA